MSEHQPLRRRIGTPTVVVLVCLAVGSLVCALVALGLETTADAASLSNAGGTGPVATITAGALALLVGLARRTRRR